MAAEFTKFQILNKKNLVFSLISLLLISGIYFYFYPLTEREGDYNKVVTLFKEDRNASGGRVRFATFDSRTYSLLLLANPNFQNCERALELLRNIQGNSERYWCRKGRGLNW